jgi:two-component system sensor histidine kinase UhpB
MGGNLDIYAIRKDGTQFPADISLSHIETDDGLLVSTAIRDATDRKRKEAQLREAFQEVERLRDHLEVENQRLAKEIVERKATEAALVQSEAQVREMAGRVVAAQEEERRRVSRELHDDVNQRLAMLAVGVGMLAKGLPDTRDAMVEKLEELKHKMVDVSQEVRQVSHRLHPSELEHLGLVQALRRDCIELDKQESIDIELDAPSEPESLPWETAVCLYRVAQESLRNAIKHSEAKKVRVTLAESGDGVQLSVTDDGTGFDIEESRRKRGLGLVSMEERVYLLRGKFSVQSAPGRGTELTAWVPTSVKRPSGSEAH